MLDSSLIEAPDGNTFIVASKELTDTEIENCYGPFIERAVASFRVDPSYLIEIAQTASQIEYKRKVWALKAEAQKMSSDPEEVKTLVLEYMDRDGLNPPPKGRGRLRVS